MANPTNPLMRQPLSSQTQVRDRAAALRDYCERGNVHALERGLRWCTNGNEIWLEDVPEQFRWSRAA